MDTTLSKEQWDEIESRLSKLQGLKEHPGTAGEAVAATEAIQRLLLKYNLSLSDFNLDKKESLKGKYRNSKMVMGAKIFLAWRQNLLIELCNANFCRAFCYKNWLDAEVIGRPENVQAVLSMHEYIVKEVRRLCNEGWKKARNPWSKEVTWRNGFYFGAVDEIVAKVHEIKDRLRQEEAGSTALVVRVEQELQDAVYEFKPHLHPDKVKERQEKTKAAGIKQRKYRESVVKIDESAYKMGQTAARAIEIQRSIK